MGRGLASLVSHFLHRLREKRGGEREGGWGRH